MTISKRILVTGGAGFIGSNFIRHVLIQDPEAEIWNLDALTYAGNLDNLAGLGSRHHFREGDIQDVATVDDVLRGPEITHLIHFAAESHVENSISRPSEFVRTNIHGTFTLLELARAYGKLDLFLQISTDEVYGSLAPDETAWTERSPYGPRSPYSATKAAADHLARAYAVTYGLPVTIVNCSNNYGPYQHVEKLIPKMITRALRGDPLTIHGDGQQIRDWLHVFDCCEAIRAVMDAGRIGETFNIGGGNELSVLRVVGIIAEQMDIICPRSGSYLDFIVHIPDRTGQDRRYAMNTEKVRRELGWRPRIGIIEGLTGTIKWYLEQQK